MGAVGGGCSCVVSTTKPRCTEGPGQVPWLAWGTFQSDATTTQRWKAAGSARRPGGAAATALQFRVCGNSGHAGPIGRPRLVGSNGGLLHLPSPRPSTGSPYPSPRASRVARDAAARDGLGPASPLPLDAHAGATVVPGGRARRGAPVGPAATAVYATAVAAATAIVGGGSMAAAVATDSPPAAHPLVSIGRGGAGGGGGRRHCYHHRPGPDRIAASTSPTVNQRPRIDHGPCHHQEQQQRPAEHSSRAASWRLGGAVLTRDTVGDPPSEAIVWSTISHGGCFVFYVTTERRLRKRQTNHDKRAVPVAFIPPSTHQQPQHTQK